MCYKSRQSAWTKVRTADRLLDLDTDPSSTMRSRLGDREGEEVKFDDRNRPR